MSKKPVHRYINEFAGRHNVRPLDTIAPLALLARGRAGQRRRAPRT